MVSPLRVAVRMSDLSRDEISDLFACVQKVETLMESEHGAKSSTIAVQDGVDAGQSISHVHVHIIPRKPGDFEFTDMIYEELQKHDKGNREIRSEKDMAEEANRLRAKIKELIS